MEVLSFTHEIVCAAGARVFKEGPQIADAAVIQHPRGTVLRMDDDEAERLVDRGHAERYVRTIHGGTPTEISRYESKRPVFSEPPKSGLERLGLQGEARAS